MTPYQSIHRSLKRAGYTLLEVIVVLVLLTVAAAVIAPSLFPNPPEPTSEVRTLVDNARKASVRRGEMLHLRIERSGTWQAIVGSPPRRELLMSGRLSHPVSSRVELVFSPLGTCAPTAESGPAVALPAYDALTCQERRS